MTNHTDDRTTDRVQAAAPLARPQPLGVLDGTAGLVLVPAGSDADDLLADLARLGRPDDWTDAGRMLEAVDRRDIGAALAGLGSSADDDINRLVLSPTPEHLEAARVAAAGDPLREAVVAAAAYASGLSDDPPLVEGVDGEFAVLALTVRAARAMEFSDAPGALRLLVEAAEIAAGVGPALHGRVLGMVAEHRFRTQHAVEASLEWYDRAIDALAETNLTDLRAGLQLERGLALHQLADVQPHRLMQAVRSYQSALIHLTVEDDPERFAVANMHIGIAYLSMPMTDASDQVRLGVAVQSLRAALAVFTPETHPWEWSSSQMNLANALQYLPSTHRAQNLAEAAEMYDAVLERRSKQSDPAGYARVLANQANALAHLGSFDRAVENYLEAKALFTVAGETDAVAAVDAQLTEIQHTRGTAS
jgi:tetratricopeptide (TPR) repeat protein